MKLIPLPALADNYIWMLHDGLRAVVVDPGDAQPVVDALQAQSLQLDAIVVTHHHPDHVEGIPLLHAATGARVYGPARESIAGIQTRLEGGQQIVLLGQTFEVIDVPGHTAGHIAYYSAHIDGQPLLFCGDTLFSGGCGRLFEGTPAQMLESLHRLNALPESTRVCCTHEYTLSNLRFALAVEPDNAALHAYYTACLALREQGRPTLPSTLAQERQINPFLRSHLPQVMQAARRHDADLTDQQGSFACLRQWKNVFR